MPARRVQPSQGRGAGQRGVSCAPARARPHRARTKAVTEILTIGQDEPPHEKDDQTWRRERDIRRVSRRVWHLARSAWDWR